MELCKFSGSSAHYDRHAQAPGPDACADSSSPVASMGFPAKIPSCSVRVASMDFPGKIPSCNLRVESMGFSGKMNTQTSTRHNRSLRPALCAYVRRQLAASKLHGRAALRPAHYTGSLSTANCADAMPANQRNAQQNGSAQADPKPRASQLLANAPHFSQLTLYCTAVAIKAGITTCDTDPSTRNAGKKKFDKHIVSAALSRARIPTKDKAASAPPQKLAAAAH